MIPLEEARDYVLGRCEGPTSVVVPLADARGLVLAEFVDAPEHVPPFANTAMDGFAVRAVDTVGAPVTLDLVGTVAAGVDQPMPPIPPGATSWLGWRRGSRQVAQMRLVPASMVMRSSAPRKPCNPRMMSA